MEASKTKDTAILILIVLLIGSAIYIVNSSNDDDPEKDELRKQILDLESDLEYSEAMLNRYDGVTVCVLWIKGVGQYEVYNGNILISEFINTTTDEQTDVRIPIYWKDYPGDTYSISIYKNGEFARNISFDVEKLGEMDTEITVDHIDMSGY